MFRAFLTFDSFIFPKLTKLIYWIGLIAIVIGTLVAAIGALAAGSNPVLAGSGFNSGLAFIAAIIGGGLGLVCWRIMVELWLVLFSIHDILKDIRDQRSGS